MNIQNLPQLAIQAVYTFTLSQSRGSLIITMSSMFFSLISIIVSILTMLIEKSIRNTEKKITITMEIIGNEIVNKSSKIKYITRIMI